MAATVLRLDVIDEIEFLRSFYPEEDEFEWNKDEHSGTLRLPVEFTDGITVEVSGKGLFGGLESSDQGRVHLSCLPPIALKFALRSTYPEETCPSFTLSSNWLNFSSLCKLCKHLEGMWSPGSVVLYDWVTFITQGSVEFLSISSPYSIVVEDPGELWWDLWDERSIQDISSPAEVLPQLVEFDRKKRHLLFSSQRFPCGVCLLTQSGEKCKRIPRCGHVFCVQCLTAYVQSRLEEGLFRMACPSPSCQQEIPHWLLKELLSPKLFERLDRLLLQKSLDQMEDLVYCPRPSCRHPTIKESQATMVVCNRCLFCFCSLCQRTWHGSESGCRITSEEFAAVRETYESGTDEERAELEKRYGKKVRFFVETMASKQWLEQNTKQCPLCRSSVEKAKGCNMMTCGSCRGYFCWLCLSILSNLNPYRHFNGQGKCNGKLFEGLVAEEEEFLIANV